MPFKKWEIPKGAKPFKKGESWNPNWRPKKRTIKVINEELKDKWVLPASMDEIKDIYLQVINADEKDLQELINNPNTPLLVKILVKNMASKRWFDVVEKMLDRAIWKSIQRTENTNTNKNYTIEDGEELNELLKDNDLI